MSSDISWGRCAPSPARWIPGNSRSQLLRQAVGIVTALADSDGFRPERHGDSFSGAPENGLPARICWPSSVRVPLLALNDLCRKNRQRADERSNKAAARPVVDFQRRADLLNPALIHHHDPVRHGERFFLVVGHIDRGDAKLALDGADFGPQRNADLGIKRRQGLVEQQNAWLDRQRPGQVPRAAAGRRKAGTDSARHAPAA